MGLSHSPKVISDGLVLYLDATNTRSYSGTGSSWYDLSVYGNNSTLVSSPTFINNKYGQLALNGSTQYSSVPYNSTLWNGQTYTLSLWAKKIGLGDGGLARGIMISKDANYIDHAYNGKTMASFRNNTGQQTLIYGNNPASYNEWRHYAFTYDGTIGILYENGAATGSTALVGNNVNSSVSPLNIGRWDGSSIYFNGCIASSMVYNRALNADEILQNYNATKYKYILKENIVTNGLILNYDMSNYQSAPFTGTSITDLSGIGNTGTLTNGPTYSSLAGGVISFDGGDDFIEVPSISSISGDFTVGVWFYTTATPNAYYKRLVDFDFRNGFWLGRNANTYTWGGGIKEGSLPYGIYLPFTNGEWHYLVSIRSGSTHILYGDGITSTISNTVTSGDLSSAGKILIAREYNDNTSFFNGNIAQVQIYNRALTAEEVLQNYNASKTRFGIS
jgi:hypothetical protein